MKSAKWHQIWHFIPYPYPSSSSSFTPILKLRYFSFFALKWLFHSHIQSNFHFHSKYDSLVRGKNEKHYMSYRFFSVVFIILNMFLFVWLDFLRFFCCFYHFIFSVRGWTYECAKMMKCSYIIFPKMVFVVSIFA